MSEKPQLVASNCDQPGTCVKSEALHLDAVDILLVIDNSNSIAPSAGALKAQLPRMLTAITTGADADLSFPPASSVHIAVTTTDMGAGDAHVPGCSDSGQDGVFVKPGQVGLTCDTSYPGYLAYEGGPASIATVDSVGCVPLVFSEADAIGDFNAGCGYEQPLEAALKSLWPSGDSHVSFLAGQGHASDENAGFLRDNSLLVVVIVTDEDDCSPTDDGIFTSLVDNESVTDAPNLRCFEKQDTLQPVQRYIDHLKGLRPNNDNVVFALIGGVPPDLISDDYRSHYDFSVPARVDAYFADVLADSNMQQVPDNQPAPGTQLMPSCVALRAGGVDHAEPPRRLVQVARGFGAQGVLGSICAADFGSTTGHIIRAVGEKLSAASAAK